MNYAIELEIPLPPMPKKRPRVTARGTYMPPEYTEWKRDFGTHCRGVKPFGGVGFGISVRFVTATGRMRCDLDNALGAVLDALQDAGIIQNDRFAESIQASKAKGPGPAIVIAIWPE